jgi:hypothetical protein
MSSLLKTKAQNENNPLENLRGGQERLTRVYMLATVYKWRKTMDALVPVIINKPKSRARMGISLL